MFVKNTSLKTIGFGGTFIVPGETGELPVGYRKNKEGKNHPTVSFYIKKGWLLPLEGKVEKDAKAEAEAKRKEADEAAKKAEADAIARTQAAEAERLAAEEREKADKALRIEARIKELSRLNLEPLRVEATNLGVEFAEGDTKEQLRQKITEKLQAE